MNTNKTFLSKEAKKIIFGNMPKAIRAAEQAVVTISRRKALKKYGDSITIILSKTGRIIETDAQYDNIVDIINYFVYGEHRYDFAIEYRKGE